MKILLVEDEILVQKSLAKLLAMKGAEVECVSSGNEAIQTIAQNSYDRVICDLMLQDVSGFDVIEESKKKYSLDEIANLFVIITAYRSAQVIEKAQEYACPVLNKPFDNMDEALNIFLS